MKQSDIFLGGEGAAWLERNQAKLPPKEDPVFSALLRNKIEPVSVLEVGCGDGWRLQAIKRKWPDCKVCGIDPGYAGDDIHISKETADQLNFVTGAFNVVIYGFCLYLCDREDLFQIVKEGDRVLEDGGFLVIHDFHTSFPHCRTYKHKEGVKSYKMDYSRLWLGNPSYFLYSRDEFDSGDDATSVVVLKKRIAGGWELRD